MESTCKHKISETALKLRKEGVTTLYNREAPIDECGAPAIEEPNGVPTCGKHLYWQDRSSTRTIVRPAMTLAGSKVILRVVRAALREQPEGFWTEAEYEYLVDFANRFERHIRVEERRINEQSRHTPLR